VIFHPIRVQRIREKQNLKRKARLADGRGERRLVKLDRPEHETVEEERIGHSIGVFRVSARAHRAGSRGASASYPAIFRG
jgi:hypothetical protein